MKIKSSILQGIFFLISIASLLALPPMIEEAGEDLMSSINHEQEQMVSADSTLEVMNHTQAVERKSGTLFPDKKDTAESFKKPLTTSEVNALEDTSLNLGNQGKLLSMSDINKKMALSVYCQNWFMEMQFSKRSGEVVLGYVVDILKRGADCNLVKSFEKSFNKILTSYELENYPLTLAWIQVAEDIQQAIEGDIKQADAFKNGKKVLHDAWKDTVRAMLDLAEYREKYIEAEESFQEPEIVNNFKKIVGNYQIIAEYLRKIAELRSLNNTQVVLNKDLTCDDYFNQEHPLILCSIDHLSRANFLLEHTIKIKRKGNSEMATLYLKFAEQAQSLAGYYQQAAESYVIRTQTVKVVWDKVAELTKVSSDQLTEIVCQLEAVVCRLQYATAGKSEGNQERATLLELKFVEQVQNSIEYYRQAVEAYIEGNQASGAIWDKAAKSTKANADVLHDVAKQLWNTIPIKSESNLEIVTFYLKFAEQEQSLAAHYRQALKTYVSANQTTEEVCGKAIESAEVSGYQIREAFNRLEKAIQAKSKSKLKIAALYFKSIEEALASAKYYCQAVEAYTIGNQVAGAIWDKAAESAKASGDCLDNVVCQLENAIQSKSKDKVEIATLYLKFSEQEQTSAQYFHQAAESYAIGDQAVGVLWNKAAESVKASGDQLDNAACQLEKAIKAKNKEKVEQSSLYSKSAEQAQALALEYLKVAQAYAEGNSEEGDRLRQTAEISTQSPFFRMKCPKS